MRNIPDSSLPLLEQLCHIMRMLRDKEHGCPWDREQDFSTIAPYTIEEAYEVVDAIDREDMVDLKGELGDLLLQVVFHAQMGEEAGHFTLDEVIEGIVSKMIRRHPHVFGEADIASAQAQSEAWEQQKTEERKMAGHNSILDDIPRNLPALVRAHKLQKRVAQIGFDWKQQAELFEKIEEELAEVQEAITEGDKRHIEEEIGDVLFVMVNLARKNGLSADEALRKANQKFERRFRAMEHMAHGEGKMLEQESLETMEQRWQKVKKLTLG